MDSSDAEVTLKLGNKIATEEKEAFERVQRSLHDIGNHVLNNCGGVSVGFIREVKIRAEILKSIIGGLIAKGSVVNAKKTV